MLFSLGFHDWQVDGITLQRSSQFCFAEGDGWGSLQEVLEATQNKVKAFMQSHREQEWLSSLVWAPGFAAPGGERSGGKNYDERRGQISRQPELLRFIDSKIGQISPDLQKDPLAQDVNTQLDAIEQILLVPRN